MNRKNWLVDVPKIAIIIFLLLNVFAMNAYPGSTIHDKSSRSGYSFTENYLSDLGRYTTYDGTQHNFYSSLFFNSSMMIAGFMLSIFFLYIRTIFNFDSGKLYWLSIIGTICGIAGAFSMIGVAINPADLERANHITVATWLFRFFLISAICYTIIIFQSDLIDNKYAIGYCIFAGLILIYILVSELGPKPIYETPEGKTIKDSGALVFQVIAQKMILFCFLITIYIQTKGLALIIDE